MNFIHKLERKFGRFAIPNLMRYIIAIYIEGFVINLASIKVDIYGTYLSLDIEKVLQGQVWRLVTFIMQPPSMSFWVLISLYMYYMIGNSLERAWGAFRFNLYFLSGILFNILAAFIIYIGVTLSPTAVYTAYPISIEYLNQAMFLAFAVMYPNMQLMLFFILPVKVKYLGWIYGALLAYQVFKLVTGGLMSGDIESISQGVAIIVALLNFLIFFLMTRNFSRLSPGSMKRKADFKRSVKEGVKSNGKIVSFNGRTVITRHKCAVCGRTELDDANLEFRFCSKCDGNYEYCMDHLYTHEHVHKELNS